MPKLIDLTGQKFGKLTVIERAQQIKKGIIHWLCQCECGKKSFPSTTSLRQAKVLSCGCLGLIAGGKNLIDLTGQKFGKLTVIERAQQLKKGNARWRCVCDCGTERTIIGRGLTTGRHKSCGCWKSELCRDANIKHSQCGTPIYQCWCNMKRRCELPTMPCWDDYGGRGITVCEEWKDFNNFHADMAATYFKGATLERNEVNGNYERSNCKWLERRLQARNTRANVRYPFGGKMLVLGEIAELTGIRRATLWRRIRVSNWPLEDAFSTPTLTPSQVPHHKFTARPGG